MSASLKIPLGANFAGRIWVGLLSFVATPLYVRWLGVEGFGVVGFYLLLQAIVGFFSAAIMDAANREIAAAGSPAEHDAVVIGFGRLAWAAGLVVGVVFAGLSHLIAAHWLSQVSLGVPVVQRSVLLMSVLLGLQMPLDFYVGALLGLRRHVAANVEFAGTATLRVLAAVGALLWWSRRVETFFWAQLASSLVMVVVGEILVRQSRAARAVAGAPSPWDCVRRSVRFSAGMTVIGLTGMLLSQADRIVLSRALPLSEFGIYSLATTLANLLYFLISPIRAAYYTEFAGCTEPAQRPQLARLYHSGCHRLAVIMLPAAAILLFFARDLLALWTSRPDLAATAAPVVMLLVGTRVISGINSLPYTLQFAHGWTTLVAKANAAAIVLLLPILYVLAAKFGAVGAAGGYFVLSVPFLFVIVWRMHRRLLQGELRDWVWADTLQPLVVSGAIAALWRVLEPAALPPAARFAWIAVAGLTTLGGVIAASPTLRPQVWAMLGQARR